MAGNNKAILAALAGNAAIAATKFVAAAITGSASMASEGVHSLVDTINQVLLLYGKRRAARRPDKLHPFGYGRELYFWTFVVAIMVFALGALVSIYQGVTHILAPEHVQKPLVNYVVLGFSLLFEGLSWRIGFRQFHASLRPGQRPWQALWTNKDLSLLAVLIEDSAAIIGLVIATIGLALSQWLDMPELDGVASLLIGLLLAFAAYALGSRSRDLLVGEAADPQLVDELLAVAAEDPAIVHANGVLTTYLGPEQMSVALSAEFRDDLSTPDIEQAIERMEDRLRERYPAVLVIFVKPQTPETWARRIRDRMGRPDAMA
ncbi:cation diffusion facilitator family transporter [Thermomonas sp. HDW16]|uniref:cation diffusion facilitator family transporter n=1 Tax=Thermomonas sp. HDW16 TaxID=2714945 RepID=UPI00140B7E6D|nr:cation diffusion facilitator family transporter [Thermomonas sp. HDW16]QIL20678.1 cation diffusion facilitator family transporter [Thermomonas sp. HDW16]